MVFSTHFFNYLFFTVEADVSCVLDPGVEGAGIRHNGRSGEADVGVRSEPAAGVKTP